MGCNQLLSLTELAGSPLLFIYVFRSKKTPKFHLLKPQQHQVSKFTIYSFSIIIEYKLTANREDNLHICSTGEEERQQAIER